MIATFSHLLEGMKVGNTKKGKTQIKLITEFSDDFLIKMEFHKDQPHLAEETSLRKIIENATSEEGDIQVFDNGLKSRKTFSNFDQSGFSFLTRLKRNPRYEVQRPFWLDDGYQDTDELGFIQDSVVKLYGNVKELVSTEFRFIQYRVKEVTSLMNQYPR